MQKIKLFWGALVLLTALPFSAAQAGDVAAGKNAYMACASCHGINAEGNPAMKGPALANLSEKYIVAQLDKFQKKFRGGNPKDAGGMMMAPMAMTVATPEAKANVAAYIASLDSKKPAKTVEGNPEAGKALYGSCMACHGADGKGNDMMNAPALANQHDWYLTTQLKHFKEAIRGGDQADATGAQMRMMSASLVNEQAIKDVVAYISTLE